MTVYEDRDNPWVSIIIGLAVVALFAVIALVGCGPTRTAKDAVRGSQGPALPAQGDVCVGPECEIPGAKPR